MRSFLTAAILAALLASASAAAADVPSYIGRRVSTAQDTEAINKVIDDFKAALKAKDVRLLSSLMLNSNILFAAPMPPEMIKRIREKSDPNFDGLPPGGFREFARFVGEAKDPIEEKFYNVKITQDDNVAWVMFDYEFLQNNKSTNHGVETWQMMKNADGQWKIASVVWTMHPSK
jgi:ketosteroid isomerase-like protein